MPATTPTRETPTARDWALGFAIVAFLNLFPAALAAATDLIR